MKFYGQFEPPVDQFIFERYFPDTNIQGIFIECGAFDGLTENSCKFFEKSMGWTGINIEPLPWVFEQLTVNRPNAINLNVALSSVSGNAKFQAVEHPVYGLDCTNGSLEHADSHKEVLDEIGCSYKEIDVKLLSWSDLVIKQNLTHVDLFVLDVEGHELSVLEGMYGADVLPNIMCVEYGHIGIDKIRYEMSKLGYVYDVTSNANAFFIKQDMLNLFAFRKGNLLKENVTAEDKLEKLREENVFLHNRITEVTHLYNEVVSSKVWKIVERIRKL